MTYKDINKENTCTIKMHTIVTVWTKWQIVIPKEVRNLLKIKVGDTLAIVTKNDIAGGFIKTEDLPKMMQYIQDEMNA